MSLRHLPFTGLLLAAIVAAPAAAAQSRDEQLLFTEPDGWHEVYTNIEDNLTTSEYVPEGQDEDNWREMLTVQMLLNTPDADPDTMLSRIAAHMAQECPQLDVQPVELGGVGEYPTLAVIIMCGKNPTHGHGEFILLRAIAGHQHFYLLQKSWRTAPFELHDQPPVSLDERKLWLGFLAYQRVCDPQREQCPVGQRLQDPKANGTSGAGTSDEAAGNP